MTTNNPEGEDLDGEFEEKDWIGVGKRFDHTTPHFVRFRKDEEFEIPASFLSTPSIPKRSTVISKFLSCSLPRISGEILATKVNIWFSKDKPNIDVKILLGRPLPPQSFIQRLECAAGQAWLDGSKSVVDQRYNQGSDRLPLWAITLWRYLTDLVEQQVQWSQSKSWLHREADKSKDIATRAAFFQALNVVNELPYNIQMPYLGGAASTLHLTRLLSTAWLSDDHINMMVEVFQKEAQEDLTVPNDLKIMGLAFSAKIKALDPKMKMTDTQRRKSLLFKVEEEVKKGDLTRLIFPIHINKNHWISGLIDFNKRTIAFANTLLPVDNGPGAPTKFTSQLQLWLKTAFGERFKSTRNTLPHTVQADTFSCGILTANVIEHAVFRRPLLQQTEVLAARVAWFVRFGSTAITKPAVEKSTRTPQPSHRRLTLADLLNAEDDPLPELVEISDDSDDDSDSESDTSATDDERRDGSYSNWDDHGDCRGPGGEDDYGRLRTPPNVAEETTDCDDIYGDEMIDQTRIHEPPASEFTGSEGRMSRMSMEIGEDESEKEAMEQPSSPRGGQRECANTAAKTILNPPGSEFTGLEGKRSRMPTDIEEEETEPSSYQGGLPEGSNTATSSSSVKKGFLGRFSNKRRRDSNSQDEDHDTTDSEKPSRKHVKAGEGESKSAIKSREQRQKLKDGTFVLNQLKYEKWKQAIQTHDPKAEFDDHDPCRWKCFSGCGEWYRAKEPYDLTRWRTHLKACEKKSKRKKAAANTPSLFNFFGAATSSSKPKPKPAPAAMPKKPTNAIPMVPCPGITPNDKPKVEQYLQRTAAMGGGGPSLPSVAKRLFNKLFSQLVSEAKRKRVVDEQMAEWKWRNDHVNVRVFSTSCERKVVDRSPHGPFPCAECTRVSQSKAFNNIIAKKPPKSENYIYVNHRFQNPVLGHLYAKTVGLKDLVEAPDAKSSVFVRFAQGALNGTLNNNVFNGLLQAVVLQNEREEAGKGMQNFKYPPEWEEMCHILRIHSPRAYEALKEHFPMPSGRNFRAKESRQPRFPMDICDRTFELVEEHLKTIGYDGAVGLSCDDTKLHASYRLYWDAAEKSHFLVGATDGPLRVADPEKIREVLKSAKAQKATKVRLWCLTIPIPKVAPIIVAALPISNSMNANSLLPLLKKIIDGLIDRKISVISYACDGTEVERAVQRMFLEQLTDKKEYKIRVPGQGRASVTIVYGSYRGQVICMVQDSKHALKTLRNNLFSGARFLIFGDTVAMFQHIFDAAQGPGTPLFSRDVVKVDRQDDNAATRLFSADVLQYLSDNHPDYVGEIIYLFVFGELIDAYQSRTLGHSERLKMVLRARYFLDLWELYLAKCGYRKDKYFISREAADILRIIIEGFIALLIIHRDHIKGPLLPYLHSSEACEHIFGDSRQIVPDFTFLDFIYMIPKLRVKLRESILRGKAASSKTRATGYNHTYFDNDGVDLALLSVFPTDEEITQIAAQALEEVDSIAMLAGINTASLYSTGFVQLPSIATWFDNDESIDKEDDDDEEEVLEDADELQRILDAEEESPISRRRVHDDRCLNLTAAALSVAIDEASVVKAFSNIGDDVMDAVIAEEYTLAATHRQFLASLPSLNLPDERNKPIGLGHLSHDQLDYNTLVELRRKHQTKYAALGVRTQKSRPDRDSSAHIRSQIIQQFHQVLRETQDEQAAGTGLGRQARWKETDAAPASGNAANAAVVSAAAAGRVAASRKRLFLGLKIRNAINLADARVTQLRPLRRQDFGFILTTHGVMIGKVIGMYSKGGGKNGKHAAVSEASQIMSLSNISLQLFQHRIGRQFRSVTDATALVQTNQFMLLPPISFLDLLDTKPTSTSDKTIHVSLEDMARFTVFKGAEQEFGELMKKWGKRKKKDEEDAD